MNFPALNTELVAVEITFSCAELATGRLEACKEKGGLKASYFCTFIVFSIINKKFQLQNDGSHFYLNFCIPIMVLFDSRRIVLSKGGSAGV